MKTQTHKIFPLMLAISALMLNLLVTPSAQAFYFTNTGAMDTARYLHTATLLTNGQVMVAGGYNFDSFDQYVSGSESYNPTSGVWTADGDLTVPRYNHTATLLPNGQVLVAGGVSTTELTDAELFDPASGNWTATGSMTNARTWHTATLLRNGLVLVAGGFASSIGTLTTCELYDPVAMTWTNTGNLNDARFSHTATLLTNGEVLVVGGDAGGGTCELYDPVAGTWSVTGSSLVARVNHTATLLPNGQVLVAGGSDDNTSELYNPNTGIWTATGLMNAIRVNPTATLLPDGNVLVAGGYTDSSQSTSIASSESYNPISGIWTATADMTNIRAQQTATLLPNGNVLMAGGFDSNIGDGLTLAEIYNSTSATLPIRLKVVAQPVDGTFQFVFTNIPGASFTALTSTNVALPLFNWTAIGSATETSPGVFQFTDLQATNTLRRFYRVRSP